MKLLSHAEFIARNGQIYYMERPVVTDKIKAKKGLTLIIGSRKITLPEGVYTLDELKAKI